MACTQHVMPMSSNARNSLFEPFEWNQTAFEDHSPPLPHLSPICPTSPPLPRLTPSPLSSPHQACTEHVMPMSSNASNSIFEPFEWNQTAFEENCLQQYGVASRPTWAMTQFGGRVSGCTAKHRI
ncbi:unnamed protein product [Closterium sp. NIES-53]